MYNGTSQLWTLLGQIEVSWLKRYPLLEVSLCIKLLLELHWVSLFQNEGFYCITCFTTLRIFIMYDHVILILYNYYFVSIYSETIEKQVANTISWSPTGQFLVLAQLKRYNCVAGIIYYCVCIYMYNGYILIRL